MNSVYHALKYFKNVEIHTFDINEKTQHPNQYVVDLTTPNIIEVMSNYPQPDIIFASPLCQSFSWLMHCEGGRLGWKLCENEQIYKVRELQDIQYQIDKNGFFKQNKAQSIQDRAILGGRLLNACIALINHFKPSFFYIENPEKSLMWDFIDKNIPSFAGFYKNRAEYSSYDLSKTNKPTIFYSNCKLDLKNYGIKGNVYRPRWAKLVETPCTKEQSARSAIPHLLIVDIFKQMEILWKTKRKK